jgi:CSLREA domain-containing protein
MSDPQTQPYRPVLSAGVLGALLLLAGCGTDDLATAPELARAGIPSVVVTTLADDVDPLETPCTKESCTLRQAILNAPTGANITFRDDLCPLAGECRIVLTDLGSLLLLAFTPDGEPDAYPSELPVTVTLNGPTRWTLTVDAAGPGSLLIIGPLTTATVRNLTLTGATLGRRATPYDLECHRAGPYYSWAGGIENYGTLDLGNVTVRDNSNCRGGAGIYNAGTLTAKNLVVSGNTSSSPGAGIHNVEGASLTLASTTITGNTSAEPDGSIVYPGSGLWNLGTATLGKGVCISGNSPEADQVFNEATLTGVNCRGVAPVDGTPPSVIVTAQQTEVGCAPGAAATFAVVFSEPVTGFDVSDVLLTGSTAAWQDLTVTGSGASYLVSVVPISVGYVVVDVPQGAATDAAGNPSDASTGADNTSFYDGSICVESD